MNIIKFNDQIIPNDLVFNTFFKGKYVYAINWLYAVPIGSDGITNEEFIMWSQHPDIFDTSSDEQVNDEFLIDSDTSSDTSSDDEILYTVNFKSIINGKILQNKTDFREGEKCIFKVFPEDGFAVYKVRVNDDFLEKTDNNEYSFNVTQDSEAAVYIIRKTALDVPLIDVNEYWLYVDQIATAKINDVAALEVYNKFTSDDEITEDELRKFRTWLAQSFLDYGLELTDIQTGTLNYYANELTDTTTTMLYSLQSSIQPKLYSAAINQTCSCQSKTTNLASLFTTNELTVCDPLALYRQMIHNQMVLMLSDSKFWSKYLLLIDEVIRYLNGILKLNFPLYSKSALSTQFIDCSKLNEKDLGQMEGVRTLTNTITALEYIKDEKTAEHQNFINESLTKFANIYELLRW